MLQGCQVSTRKSPLKTQNIYVKFHSIFISFRQPTKTALCWMEPVYVFSSLITRLRIPLTRQPQRTPQSSPQGLGWGRGCSWHIGNPGRRKRLIKRVVGSSVSWKKIPTCSPCMRPPPSENHVRQTIKLLRMGVFFNQHAHRGEASAHVILGRGLPADLSRLTSHRMLTIQV